MIIFMYQSLSLCVRVSSPSGQYSTSIKQVEGMQLSTLQPQLVTGQSDKMEGRELRRAILERDGKSIEMLDSETVF